jgi:heme exporter protein D
MRTGKPTIWEWVTNLGPIAFAVYAAWQNFLGFEYVGLSVLWGLLATFAIVLGYHLLVRTTTQADASREMQPTFEKLSWMFLAALLLLAAVNRFNETFFNEGVFFLSSNKEQSCLWGLKLHVIDIASLSFGIWLVGGLLFIPLTANVLESTRQRQGFVRIVKRVWIPTLIAGMVITAVVVYLAFPHAKEVGSSFMCEGERPLPRAPDIEDGTAILSVLGVLLFVFGYLLKHRTLVELHAAQKAEQQRLSALPGDATIPGAAGESLLLSKNLRLLVLNAVVLPPIIVGIAMASGSIDIPTSVIYGVFIYSGFAVWGLAIQIAREKGRGAALGIILLQFVYAFLMTVLWISICLSLKNHLAGDMSKDFFAKAFKFALGAIFIQVVFGPVYVKTWGSALSEKWAQSSSDYFIFAMIVAAGLAAFPQSPLKLVLVVVAIATAMFGPAIILRRSLTAYVLIRVRPGSTEKVMQKLAASDVTATVVYGEFDVIAKLEIQGRSTLRSREAPDDGQELAELAATVKGSIRNVDGILETQTLLDFSGFVELPREVEALTSPRPNAQV